MRRWSLGRFVEDSNSTALWHAASARSPLQRPLFLPRNPHPHTPHGLDSLGGTRQAKSSSATCATNCSQTKPPCELMSATHTRECPTAVTTAVRSNRSGKLPRATENTASGAERTINPLSTSGVVSANILELLRHDPESDPDIPDHLRPHPVSETLRHIATECAGMTGLLITDLCVFARDDERITRLLDAFNDRLREARRSAAPTPQSTHHTRTRPSIREMLRNMQTTPRSRTQ